MTKVAGDLKGLIQKGVSTHMIYFPQLYKSTTPGPEGQRGLVGPQGVSVDHIKGTSTTNLEGDFGKYGETDTYTLYGDADETMNLGHFSVTNGIEGKDSYEYAAQAGYTGTEAEFYEELRQVKAYRDQAETASISSRGYRDQALGYRDQAQVAAVASADSAIASEGSATAAADSAASITDLFTPTNVKSYYESNADTNVFTDAEKSKLLGVETGATGDMTGAEIKALYEAQAGKVLDSVTRVDLGTGAGPGQMTWNNTDQTVDVKLSGSVTLQMGQELVVPVRNNTGTSIANGKVVMATGTLGASGRITIDEHDGLKTSAMRVLGLATHTIVAGADGLVTSYGKVRGIDTTGTPVGEVWNQGDILYIKPNNRGDLTKVVPTAGQLSMPIAFVLYKHGTMGVLEVRVSGVDENKYAEAAAVAVTPQGNLSGTTVQSALVELQTDLDKLLVVQEW